MKPGDDTMLLVLYSLNLSEQRDLLKTIFNRKNVDCCDRVKALVGQKSFTPIFDCSFRFHKRTGSN